MTSSCPFETPLSLSERDRRGMHNLAQRCMSETLLDFEHVLASKSGLPSATRWKPVKRKENVVVYQDRLAIEEIKRQKRKTRSLGDLLDSTRVGDLLNRSMGPTVHRQSAATYDPDTSNESKELPKMIWMGTVECDLDDLMYGLVSQNDAVTRIKSSYSGNDIQDFATLASLATATSSDPFYGLQLKWEVNSALTKAKPVWRCRDFVYLEATGVTKSRTTGQRIGYRILHSLDVRGVPELPGRKLTRGKVTIYQLFRQKAKGTVEVFAKAMVDLAGDVPASVAAFATAEAATSVNQAAKCALKRKLNWLLSTSVTSENASSTGDTMSCSVCSRDFRSHFAQKSFFECVICTKRVCHRCRVSKRLSFLEPERANSSSVTVVKKTLDLCNRCVHTAAQTNARRVALEERMGDSVAMYKYMSRQNCPPLEEVQGLQEEIEVSGTSRREGVVLLERHTQVFHSIA
ncbi:hypothetical protein BBJ28_00009474 [Nothophytophthora sp. Chile5]|nr:hypothetical protein BBJ28_00009474 [Nothophytophthora sp. Chile5]